MVDVDPISEAIEAQAEHGLLREAKPHRLVAKINRFGEPVFDLECPYTLADRKVRRCNLGTEPETPCEWYAFESGDHHKDCPAYKTRDAKCLAPLGGGKTGLAAEDDMGCWPEIPEECDGFESAEVGHMHPIEGCWARQLIAEVGWDDVVAWRKDYPLPPEGTVLPLDVDVWSDDEGVTIAPWGAEPKPKCPTCDHPHSTVVPSRFRSRGPFCNDPFHEGEPARA